MKRILLLCGILSGAALPMIAAEMTVDELLNKMEAADKNAKTVRFAFTQEIRYTLTDEAQESTGEVTFKKPGSVHYKQLTPLEQVIISDGKKVWVYTPSYKQVISDSWSKWTKNSLIPASLMNFGQDWAGMKSKYSFALAGKEGGSYVLTLAPLEEGEWQMKLWIDEKTFAPGVTRLESENISVTTTTSDYTVNPPVDDNLFRFKAPPGTETMQLP